MKHQQHVDALEFRRDQYGLSQSEWAYILGLSPSHYNDFIKGRRGLSLQVAAKAFEYGVPAEAIFQCKRDKGYGDIMRLLADRKVKSLKTQLAAKKKKIEQKIVAIRARGKE